MGLSTTWQANDGVRFPSGVPGGLVLVVFCLLNNSLNRTLLRVDLVSFSAGQNTCISVYQASPPPFVYQFLHLLLPPPSSSAPAAEMLQRARAERCGRVMYPEQSLLVLLSTPPPHTHPHTHPSITSRSRPSWGGASLSALIIRTL